MTDFKLKGYTITSEKAYNVLKKYDNISDKTLKKLDTNGDSKIDENELIELVEESDKSSSKSDDKKKDDDNKETDATKSTMQQIDYYQQQNNQLSDKILNLSNELIGEDDPETITSVVGQLNEYQSQVDANCKQIYSLLVKKEELEEEAKEAKEAASEAANTAGLSTDSIGLSAASAAGANEGTSYSSEGSIAKSSGASANYALKYDGKGASEMSSIMRNAGSNFHSGAWCADFATFATKQANKSAAAKKYLSTCSNTAYCPTIGKWARDNNLYTTDVSKVKPGDFILYGSAGSERHIGIVTAVNSDGSVDTIEGNTSDDNGRYTNGVVNQHHHVKSFGGFVMMH